MSNGELQPWTETDMPKKLRPVSPGEILAGRRAISADTDLRLCRFFGLSDGWWLRSQADYDTEVTKATLAKALAKIKPWAELAGGMPSAR
jgi:plasmid maintenance system antidote protein VapI